MTTFRSKPRFSPMLRPAALVALLLMARSAPARADDVSDRHDAAVALLNQMHTIDNVSAMLPGIIAQVRQAVTRGDPDLIKQFQGFAPKLQGEAEAEKLSLIEQLADIYAKTFTADEIKEMAAFYQTPLGQKIVSTQAQIGSEILTATRNWGQRVGQKLVSEAAVNLQSAP